MQRYGVSNVLQSKEVLDRVSDDRHSGELARRAAETKQARYGSSTYNNMEKNRQTKLDRYGSENYNNPEKYKETSLSKYGTEHPNQAKVNRDKISQSRLSNNSHKKAEQTIIAKYGDIRTYYQQVALKRYQTMKRNGTLGHKETQPEKELYQELCAKYGTENVVKQYYDKDRYPFRCDFYVKSEDKFIELHGFWTHGPHPFDEHNADDLKLLADLQNDGSSWAKSIIYTWTDLDVRKLKTAQENNLNYQVIYWYRDSR